MSTRYGGLAVTAGLVCCYDFGNVKSYAGAGAPLIDCSNNGTNATQIPSAGGFNAGSGAYFFSGAAINDSFNAFRQSTVIPANFTIQTVHKVVDNIGQVALWGGTLYPSTGMALGYGQSVNKWSFYSYWPSGVGSQQLDFGPIGTLNPDVVTITYDGTTYKAYLNGGFAASGTGGYFPRADADLQLGWMQGGQWGRTSGYFYSMSVYNRALTQAEVSQNYSALKGRLGLT